MVSRLQMRCRKYVLSAVVVAASVSLFAVQTAAAQGVPDSNSTRGGRNGGGGRGGMDRGPNQGPSKEMIELWQKNYEQVLRKQVTFSEEQVVKWRAWNTRFDAERRPLFQEEREIRRTLGMQLARGVTPDEAKVVDAMDRWSKLEHKRLDLKDRENKALAAFLSPIQRARFFALQDQTERMFREADGRRDGRGGPGGRGGPPFGGDTTRMRQGMRGDSTGGKFPRGGQPGRAGGKVDTIPVVQKPRGN